MKKLLCFLLALSLLLPVLSALSEEYRELKEGMSGSDVQRLKKAMYWLGYFNTLDLDGNYTAVTAKRVKRLQKANGLEETGVADPALQALVFSGNAVKSKTAPKPSPTPGPAPTVMPTMDVSAYLPKLTEEGFLSSSEEGEEYVLEDAENGVWIYASKDLSITVSRYEVTYKKYDSIVWYEADIRCTPASPLRSILTEGKTPGKKYVNPVTLARQSRAVLAIADDHFGDRRYAGRKVGVVIRNGEIHSEKTYKAGSNYFPNLDVLAVLADGSLKTFLSDEHTAQEYLDLGVISTYAFGPILIRDGKLSDDMLLDGRYVNREPRCALGMIAPYHYFIIVSKGRTTDSKGATIPWIAQRMLERGVTEALNLDGGGTAALIFMGQPLNRKSIQNMRSITSITAFGASDAVPSP